MLAIIADSPSLARTQLADAVAFAHEQSIPVEVVQTSELERPEYVRNDSQRCFFCKDELFTLMEELRGERGFDAIAYGVNLDDEGDFRPGQKAASAHKIMAPLRDAGLTKDEIRTLARKAGLRIWDKPASACLSSRIEYGRPVTREALDVVEKGEDAVRGLGFRQFRCGIMGTSFASKSRATNCRERSIPRWPRSSQGYSRLWASSSSLSTWRDSGPAP